MPTDPITSVRWALTADCIELAAAGFPAPYGDGFFVRNERGVHHLPNALLRAGNAAMGFPILSRLRFPVWTAAMWAWHPPWAESGYRRGPAAIALTPRFRAR